MGFDRPPGSRHADRLALQIATLSQRASFCTTLPCLHRQDGVAPSTDAVLQRLEERRASLPEAHRPKPAGTSSEAKGRMWARRWRQKWGGRIAKVRVQDDVSVQELQDKAPPERKNCGQNPGSNLVLFSDAKLAPPTCPAVGFQWYGQISGAFSRPDSGRKIGPQIRPTLAFRRRSPRGAGGTIASPKCLLTSRLSGSIWTRRLSVSFRAIARGRSL